MEYVNKLQEKLAYVYQIARETLKKNAVHQKKDYDSRISKHNYEVWDLVLCINTAKC